MPMKPIKELNIPNQVVALVEGLDGARKTTFSLTAPAPIGYLNFDRGLGRVRKELLQRDIKVATYPFRKATKDAEKAAQDIWKQANDDLHNSIDDNATTVIDTLPLLYECIRLALLGKLEKVKSRYYGEVNRAMNDIFDHALDAGTNLIVICPLQDEYAGEDKTGDLVPAGWKDVRYRVNQRLRLEAVGDSFEGTIYKPSNMGGITLKEPDFTSFATTVFPDTDEDDWGDA